VNFEDCRTAVYTRLDTYMTASQSTVKVDYENRHKIDLSTQVNPFVSCEIVWNDGEQVSMSDTPRARFRGAIWLGVWTKEGSGTKVSNQLLKSLTDLFRTKSFSGVTTMMPIPVPARPADGWYVQTLRVPLYFDDAG
jgi:hypothetical protein